MIVDDFGADVGGGDAVWVDAGGEDTVWVDAGTDVGMDVGGSIGFGRTVLGGACPFSLVRVRLLR